MIPPKTTTDDVTFIKQVPVYPRDPKKFILKRKSKNVKPIYRVIKQKEKCYELLQKLQKLCLKVSLIFRQKILNKTNLFDTSHVGKEKVMDKTLEAWPADGK